MKEDDTWERLRDIMVEIFAFSTIIMVITALGGFWALVWGAPHVVQLFFGRMALTFFSLDVVMLLVGCFVFVAIDD